MAAVRKKQLVFDETFPSRYVGEMRLRVHFRDGPMWRWCAVAFGAAVLLAYVISYLRLPFADQDTLLYTMIGQPLVTQGVLPYGAVFDHKPIGLYAIYGAWNVLLPLSLGTYTLFALAAVTIMAALARGWGLDFGRTWLGLVVLGAPFGVLSGNAELAYLPLMFACVICLTQENGRMVLLGGFLAGLAVEVNYLAAPALLLPIVYALVTCGQGFRRGGILVLGGVAGLGVPLLPYLFDLHAARDYFDLQHRYLHHYGASSGARLKTVCWFALWMGCVSPVLMQRVGDRRAGLLRAWAAGGIVACLASGYPFAHYFLLVLAPVVLMMGLSPAGQGGTRWRLLPLGVLSVIGLYHDTHHNVVLARQLAKLDIAALHEAIGNEPVLDIEASHVPFALAHLRSQGRFLFPEHVRRLYGTGSVAYYSHELDHAPRFVIAGRTLCPSSGDMADICRKLADRYVALWDAPGVYGYRVYRRRDFQGNQDL